MKYMTFLLVLLACTEINAQSAYVPKRTMTYDLIDRYSVLYDIDSSINFGTSNIFRSDITPFALDLYQREGINDLTQKNLSYLIEDNLEYLNGYATSSTNHKTYVDSTEVFYTMQDSISSDTYVVRERDPILRYFYKEKATFLKFENEDILIKANPLFNIGGGISQDENTNVFQNTRGLMIRGLVDQKVYFFTTIIENQRAFFNFQNERINAIRSIPGNGLFKGYQSKVAEQLTGFDYLNAQGYIGLPVSKHISLEFGHGNHFIGDGYRSLLLSDHAHNYFYLKLNTRVWKFQLQNIFAELAAVSNSIVRGDNLINKKYFATHYLTFNATKNLSLSLFETVIFSRENNFELQYLNPIILYRTVEHFIGSPDNVMIGVNGRWDIKNRVSLYGQLILDELKIDELTAGTGWWANKYGIQAGVKYFNALGVDHLDLQAEYNFVRPFTYSHRQPIAEFPGFAQTSYSHHNQPLAHPLGANFQEILLRARYQPSEKWTLYAKTLVTKFGADTPTEIFGGNILIPNGQRSRNFGYDTGDGDLQDIFALEIQASYMFAHNYFVDFTGLYRTQQSDSRNLDTQYYGIGFRANMVNMPFDY